MDMVLIWKGNFISTATLTTDHSPRPYLVDLGVFGAPITPKIDDTPFPKLMYKWL